MMSQRKVSARTSTVLIDEPLDGESLLLDAVYGRPARLQATEDASVERPQHYKIVSISLYNEDIARLNSMVRELKRRGHYKANKSQLIRYALSLVDLDKVPREISRPAQKEALVIGA